MKVSAVIYSGKKTEIINGESFTADAVEVAAAFVSHDRAVAALTVDYVDVAEPKKWGMRSACVYDFEVIE